MRQVTMTKLEAGFKKELLVRNSRPRVVQASVEEKKIKINKKKRRTARDFVYLFALDLERLL